MKKRSLLLLIILYMSAYAQSQEITTPRIYYHEEKLIGNPIETKKINLKKFNSIIQNAHQEDYMLGEKSKLILVDGEFESVNVEMFKYCTIRKDGTTYEAEEGNFYLPEAIILYDVSDFRPYPSEFYFIAKINNQLELRRCSGGEGAEWYKITDLSTTVQDMAIIEKVEETIDYLEGFVVYLAEEQKEAEAEAVPN